MNAQRVAGLTALITGLLLVFAVTGSAMSGGTGTFGNDPSASWQLGPGMMGASHTGHGMMGFGSSGPTPTTIPGATEVRVQAASFAFTPSQIQLPENADVNLTLTNSAGDRATHDLTVPALGIHIVAGAGEARTVGLRGLTAGRYDAYCGVPGHADLGMRASVVVGGQHP